MIDKRINVRGIVFRDGKILAQQLTPGSDGHPRDWWCIPGGGKDELESLIDCIKREMVEETGVVPEIGKLLFIQQFYDGKRENLEFFFHIKNANDYENIDLTKTSHGVEEIKQVEFIDPSDTSELPLYPQFLQTIDIADYIKNDKPVFIFVEGLKN
ncbi:MAG: NUDIX hydrolase [Candidatus Saccharibacteria bacterium]